MRANQINKWNAYPLSHLYLSLDCRYLRSRAGLPATSAFLGTSLVTTLPAPTSEFSPIVTLASIVAPDPIDAPFLTKVRATFQSASVCICPLEVVALGYKSLMNITPWPMNTLSSIVTPSQMNEWLEILQFLPTVAPFC